MARNERAGHKAKRALIALRKALGKTQQAFAVEILKTAITTVARYETSHPPRGEVLLRLADIALSNGHADLAGEFRFIYLDEILKNLKFDTIIDPVGRRGYLLSKLSGPDEIELAQSFLWIKSGLDSTVPEIKQRALEASSFLKKAADDVCGAPMVRQFQDSSIHSMRREDKSK
jgi:hypothetical protein